MKQIKKSKIEPLFNNLFFMTLFLVVLVVASLLSVICKVFSIFVK